MRRRSQAGFEELYEEYGARIYGLCRGLCSDATDAEDLAQEVLVRAYQSLDRFEGRSSVLTWLYRIAVNRWQQLRSRYRSEGLPLDDGLLAAASVADPATTELTRLSLEAGLDRLPQPLREAFILVKGTGLKYREAAEVLGIPKGTVESRVHDAGVRLRALLAEEPEAVDAPARRRGAAGIRKEVADEVR